MSKKVLLEVCCGSADDVIQSHLGGADRVELSNNLFHGGLTPTIGTVRLAKERSPLPVIAMVRPRQGGFCYTEVEFAVALTDAREMIRAGADGLVFGFLHADGTIDEERCKQVIGIAKEAGKEAVFHRAIDVTPDWKRALDSLISLGVDRVLTSGQEPDVFFAMDTIREMVNYAGDSIQILPGAGVTLRNAAKIAEYTGATQLHIARFKPQFDASTANNRDIYFGGALYPPEDRYDLIDGAYIQAVTDTLNKHDNKQL
ncbi:MAG: copper homeostasis protein CutC [Christensenellales bacterium]|jgi:copper homeostasis protein